MKLLLKSAMKNIETCILELDSNWRRELGQKIASLFPNKDIYIGFSGGVDSTVLLHLLSTVISKSRLTAVYINHNMQNEAEKWGLHCKKVCSELGIKFITKSVKVMNNNQGLESSMREARYIALKQLLGPNDILAMAHHQDDQIETILLRLFRGSGPKGLTGMKETSSLYGVDIFRPLLNFDKSSIISYAKRNNLEWIEDPSNTQTNFDRNFIRSSILPSLRDRWPAVNNNITRASKHCFETQNHLDKELTKLTTKIITNNKIEIKSLKEQNPFSQKYILRTWINNNLGYPPNSKQLEYIQNNIINAKIDKCPTLQINKKIITRYNHTLYINEKNTNEYPKGHRLLWPANINEIKIDLYQITLKKTTSPLDLNIRFREDGERFTPNTRQGSHPLKKLMQEWKIPPWMRNKIPLIYHGEKLIAVAGYATIKCDSTKYPTISLINGNNTTNYSTYELQPNNYLHTTLE